MSLEVQRDIDQLPIIEVGSHPVRLIASNIRAKDEIDWRSFVIGPGRGYEGDLVLAEVTEVGARQEFEYLDGETIIDVPLMSGDLILGVLANRHSGTSEYGEVPQEGLTIEKGTRLDLLAAGGIVGICLGVPKTLGTVPTRLEAIGLLNKPDNSPFQLTELYPRWETELHPSVPIILSCGTAAEIGKTTTAKQLIASLYEAGTAQVGASKLAGTGRKRDILSLKQVGARPAYDFPDVGLPTTYTRIERYTPAVYTLLNKINRKNPAIIIAECGGDIIEGNIPALLNDPNIMRYVVAIIHSSTDALGIWGSLDFYRKWGVSQDKIYLTYPYRRNFTAIKERINQLGVHLPIFDPLNHEEMQAVIQTILGRIF
ncbi:MAG: hypothetical protein UV61_C0005G0066 [Candidatus Gottesmanbacteria bacterium GW2011_GWB1_43_11]|uniref:DUF1611 domain-containing protein n=1 Tax=Candidatus Gottesmanbacteria bacterium GW2011_GWB1_43_11 TaxID=1618446 RepID=A0A0G1CMR1_9BACT|nr:MAG: hypothetical protein UV04_C0008G0024 [Candidatus Gottesmanbacteria bacterium GW2011_GWA2_42_16]KKS87045.1 MAG: hypothetical protein UV61_C0005G0066 [Candidatus Gottesmanbacteria bacterium GW2011_GWB1_43_11]OGG07573.1 MAG: hypothetical protein A2699_04915 [Candidatus Gottesmanbacteria bacterium RIFCSPHIGHO2_01_FULL_43_15]OGG26301.1 MAG: hypothetical protein A3A59_03680 [Candidatus Gottesmanbacteria bacterium RIFCSPLOWO2_01_FULL_42_10]HCM38179.1 hypothetical protein [Patescibacteria group